MEIRHAGIGGKARNLRVAPIDGEKDGRVAQYAEVEAVVGVLPDVVAAQNKVPAYALLEAGVELVAESGW